MAYRFKRAETPAEFEAIFKLNHSVFASELRQHQTLESERLIDKFHEKNVYVIALLDARVIGMVAAHGEPPFSVAQKLADPRVLEEHGRLMEIRLLAVEPAYRNGVVMAGLMVQLYELVQHHDAIVISGLMEETRMYHRLGFRDLGPAVPAGGAWFVPMIVPVTELGNRRSRWKQRLQERSEAVAIGD